MDGKRVVQVALIALYIAVPLAVTVGTYYGWLFQSGTSKMNIAVSAFLGLVGATILSEYTGVFEIPATGWDALKGIAYWAGAVLWIAIAVRRVPDNRTGVSVLVGPTAALMMGGMFHLSRFAGMCIRLLTGTITSANPLPVVAPIPAAASPEVPRRSTDAAGADRVDIAPDIRRIALRVAGGTAGLLILPVLLKGTSYNGFVASMSYAGAISLGAIALRSLPSRAPVLSLTSDGIFMRRDLCAIRYLPWTEIVGFEMKSAVANTFLVIHVRDADALIAQRGPLSRWLMRQSQAMFGSPVQVPIAWLNCDPGWLWQKLNEMLMRHPERHVSPGP